MILNILLSVVVSATLDSTTMTLGDQTGLHLEAKCAPDEVVVFPKYEDELIPCIEIVEQSAIDSSVNRLGKRYTQTLMLTSFEDSLFFVSPIAFACGTDSFYTEALTLNFIQPFEMDSTNNITDIHDIQQPPFYWKGLIRWILGMLLLAGLGLFVWWLLGKIGHFHGGYLPENKKEPERPAEEVALEALDRIREQKIWTQGQTKQYHTELTDVLRTYIAKRFSVASNEKTSDETLRAMKPILNEQKELYTSLSQVLKQADLVKFAKWQTTPDENESALQSAYTFVNDTKPKPATDVEVEATRKLPKKEKEIPVETVEVEEVVER